MEEIDIIELLKRVKEGKAPKKIKINEDTFILREDKPSLEELYYSEDPIKDWLECIDVYIDTKIKILDKPIIEELEIKDEGGKYISPDTFEITAKVNEIIRYLRSKDE